MEVLTARYATAAAALAWRCQLKTLEPLEAFQAVMTDPAPKQSAVVAAVALVSQIHRLVDAAATALQARSANDTSSA